jgi:hypothetical protein
MSAIIDYDVEWRNLFFESRPEIAVGLISNIHFDAIAFIVFARRFDVDAVNSALSPEILSPHIEAPAAVDPDLENPDFTAPESAQMSIVDVKIVLPFPYPASLSPGFKEGT